MKSLLKSERLDQLGITASVGCAIHCAALPLMVTSLPLIGMEFLASPWVETSMIVLSVIIAVTSLSTTYKRHRNTTPLLALLCGFALIASGHFLWHEAEALLIPLGGITIAAAHYINWKLNRVCTHNIDQRENP
ncbi:MerC domain-containing protein [Pedobacter deserti]|uniref:MerC domain-containing protein n=1 Tax=Pedobacter deserti TaxID=2817382 RepID=UPI00210877F5|nr:MerC domain-containing protein [Pedobacter sp. SYSU D00382]